MEFKNILAILFYCFCLTAVNCNVIQDTTGRVVGGVDVLDGAHPYQASLQLNQGNNYFSHFCGGSFISEYFVLTAAHCVVNKFKEGVVVFGGSSSLKDPLAVRFNVDEFFVSPEYNTSTMYADIALVKLETPVDFSTGSIRPIGLPTANHVDPTPVNLTGWGYNAVWQIPDRLQRVELDTLEVKQCAIEAISSTWPITPCHVCTNGVEGFGACNGDSGGPLINEDNVQVGTVSWGWACALGMPDVYCRVSCFTQWILEVIEGNGN